MSEARVHKLKWRWLPDVRVVNGLTVGIVESDEPPSPEYVVVILREYGFEEVARCDRFLPGAYAKMRERAENIADLLQVAEYMWSEEGLLTISPE